LAAKRTCSWTSPVARNKAGPPSNSRTPAELQIAATTKVAVQAESTTQSGAWKITTRARVRSEPPPPIVAAFLRLIRST